MHQIIIISASVRTDRKSHRAAIYMQSFLKKQKSIDAQIIDLKSCDFPIFEERLKYLKNPDSKAVEFGEMINKADGVIIVTPEYNGGYPASLKNVTDLLYAEWYHKPVAFVPVSSGDFGGTQVITSILFSFWKMRAMLVPVAFHVSNIEKTFDENGRALEKQETDARTQKFIDELMWAVKSTAINE